MQLPGYMFSVLRPRLSSRNTFALCLAMLLYLLSRALVLNAATVQTDTHDPIAVIVNPTLASQITSLPSSVLPSIFSMHMRTWPNDTQIRVFVLASDDPVHATFCKQTLGVFPRQIRAAWDRQIYSGSGQAPTEVSSEQEMRERVATTAGAIGYLRTSMLDASVKSLPIGQ